MEFLDGSKQASIRRDTRVTRKRAIKREGWKVNEWNLPGTKEWCSWLTFIFRLSLMLIHPSSILAGNAGVQNTEPCRATFPPPYPTPFSVSLFLNTGCIFPGHSRCQESRASIQWKEQQISAEKKHREGEQIVLRLLSFAKGWKVHAGIMKYWEGRRNWRKGLHLSAIRVSRLWPYLESRLSIWNEKIPRANNEPPLGEGRESCEHELSTKSVDRSWCGEEAWLFEGYSWSRTIVRDSARSCRLARVF